MSKQVKHSFLAILGLLSLTVTRPCLADGAPVELSNEITALRPFAGKVAGSNVRIRLQPELSSPVVELLEEGSLLVVVGEKEDFYAVAPPSASRAYIYRPYVLDGVVEGSHVNVRLEPDVDAPIVTQLNTGDMVKGQICARNPRWMEIAMPESARFFVAKEYIENIGMPELVTRREERREAAQKLLQTTYLASQQELNRPFAEIDFESVKKDFLRVKEEFPDFPELGMRAEAVLDMVQQFYAEKKLAAARGLEQQVVPLVEMKPFAELDLDRLDSGLASRSPARVEFGLEPAVDREVTSPLALATPAVEREFVTDRMLAWQPVEEGFYEVWAMERSDANLDEFYLQQALDGVTLSGIVQAYDRPVRNRPGDFVLVQGNRPVAFLYSTRINLDEITGRQVTVKCLPRPNHHFAFPAYFVLQVDGA